MARKSRSKYSRKIIRVFCEGESEQAYTDFLKKQFSDVASIKYPKGTGLFETAQNKFLKDPQYRDYTNEIDEVWFFFDVELKDVDKWKKRYEIIKEIRKLKKKPGIMVRLLMTTGCLEYWLMLHYKLFAPSVQTEAEKERIVAAIKELEPNYEKGDKKITARIAQNYPCAVKNAEIRMNELLPQELVDIADIDVRNRWLYQNCLTFSTVYEAIKYLEQLPTCN